MKNALALGTFDGVHKGHQAVLSLPDDCRKIAVTFSRPPKNSELIITNEDKCRILKEIGIDEIVSLSFEAVKDISAVDFLDMLCEKFTPSVFSCGFNNRFGKGAEGDTALLKHYCEEKGIKLICAEPVTYKGEIVSSTRIREMLRNGEVKAANEILYEPFSFTAKVMQGDKRGRTIGFPTVNQRYPENLVKLKFGVYKTKINIDGKEYCGITDIGTRPTFKTDYVISETFIKDFSGDLYGKELKITPLEFLRDEKKFNSLEELKKQIAEDLRR
ncbi:MAG: riboflavin biosynthesis protein RibF [Clostridia bacterium]|nr:riboflavin biosynthesis protein RibF [Clostridia bacterium]